MADALFAGEVSELHDVMMAVENAVFTPEEDDPRNLDPDDGALEEMFAAAIRLQSAAEKLKSAVSAEMSRRNDILDAMPIEDFEKWEAAVAAKHRESGEAA